MDASRAVSSAPTGTEYYSQAMIRALVRASSPFQFLLYTRSTPPVGLFPQTDNVTLRVMPFPRLWTHLRLSYEMLTNPPDVLWVPAHVLPLIRPRAALVTVHDLGFKYFPHAHPFWARMYLDLSTRWNARAADVVIADSLATRDDLIHFYRTPADKIRVVYPAYDAEMFKPTRDAGAVAAVRANYGLGERYILSVGTRQPRKNYPRLIEGVARLEDVELVIVGKEGWLAEPTTLAVAQFGMQARVKLLDYVPRADLPLLYVGAQAAVFPSLYEGFGLPALEAQACGTPLVCSNTSSLPEVAGDGALFFDPFDVGEMAEQIGRVLEERPLREELVARGMRNLERFSWERAAGEIVEIVRGV